MVNREARKARRRTADRIVRTVVTVAVLLVVLGTAALIADLWYNDPFNKCMRLERVEAMAAVSQAAAETLCLELTK